MAKKKKRKLKKRVKVFLIMIVLVGVGSYVYKDYSIKLEEKRKEEEKQEQIRLEKEKQEQIRKKLESIDYDSLDTKGKLDYMSKTDDRIQKIIDNYDSYPEILIEMLTRNKDMTSYMVDYIESEGKVNADNIGKVKKGTFPLLLQYDKKWGYGIYGDKVMAINGCGPTVLAMVLAGLTGNNDVTPYELAKFSEEQGYYEPEWGTSWNLMTEGISKFGIIGENIVVTENNFMSALENGQPIACSVRPGDFTTLGHFILLTGVEDGKITVNDPNSKERSSKLWDYSVIAPQVKSAWKYHT